MKSFSTILSESSGSAVFFMGQAGLILKSGKGMTLGVDLYLTDCCERFTGFKRLMPYLLAPEEYAFDYLIATHAHYDHFDYDAMTALTAPEKTRLIAAHDCRKPIGELGIPSDKVRYAAKGERLVLGDFIVDTVECDHGSRKPEALGLIIRFDGRLVYITGDTAPLPALAEVIAALRIDLMMLPINGAFGNLNERQAAEICRIVRPNQVIPCHYWNFAEHGGNPGLFVEELKRLCPDQRVLLMRPGERYGFA